MNVKKFFISIIVVVALFVPAFSSAARSSILDTGIIDQAANCGQEGQVACSLNIFVQAAVNVASFILGIVGALTLLMFVFGGLTWILSGGSSSAVKKGKDIIIGSVVGLLIVFSSYLIINFVVNDVLKVQGDFKFTGSIPDEVTIVEKNNTCEKNGGTCKKPCEGNDSTVADDDYCKNKDGSTCCKTGSKVCKNDGDERCFPLVCPIQGPNGENCEVSRECKDWGGMSHVCCSTSGPCGQP